VGFAVHTAASVNCTVLWDKTVCISVPTVHIAWIISQKIVILIMAFLN